MKEIIINYIDDAVRKAKRKRLFRKVLSLLAVLTVISTSLYLRSPASTLEINENEGVGIINSENVLHDIGGPAEEGEDFYLSYGEDNEKQITDMEDVEPAAEEAGLIDLVDITNDWDESEKEIPTAEENAADECVPVDPIYDLNGESTVLLSTVLASAYPEINVKNGLYSQINGNGIITTG